MDFLGEEDSLEVGQLVDFFLFEVGSYLGGRCGEGEEGGLILRAMEMGVVLWDFFLTGPLPAELYDFLALLPADAPGCLSESVCNSLNLHELWV